MKKKILAISACVLVVGGFLLWVYFQDITREDTSIPLSEQKVVITVADADVENLEIKASVQQADEEGNPVFRILLTNNSDEDLVIYDDDYKVYFKEGQEWKLRRSDGENELLESIKILCPESIESILQNIEDPPEIDNTHTFSPSPWGNHDYMNYLGEYRMEYSILNTNHEQIGTIWIEWKQELKE